jgi:ubiquinone biosynthesis monooxygenase Coq7
MLNLDPVITALDNALRTVFAPAHAGRPTPGGNLPEAEMSEAERRHVAALMRVNHAGEVCAQALYQGQALTARNPETRTGLERAGAEETDHLAWTEQRIADMGGRRSLLDPLWYAGSFAIGAAAGLIGDRWSLGFLAETERQVEQHLDGHLGRLPAGDERSRAILEQMKADEVGHAVYAERNGAAELPAPVKDGMRAAARLMTGTAYWI